MQLFIEEYTFVFHFNCSQQIFWHSAFKLSYLQRPIVEEYFYWVLFHSEKWWPMTIDTIGWKWTDGSMVIG